MHMKPREMAPTCPLQTPHRKSVPRAGVALPAEADTWETLCHSRLESGEAEGEGGGKVSSIPPRATPRFSTTLHVSQKWLLLKFGHCRCYFWNKPCITKGSNA